MWLLYNHVVSFKQWSTTINHYESVSENVLKAEFSIPRSYDASLQGNVAWIAVNYNAQHTDSTGNTWLGESTPIGFAPAKNAAMYKVFFQ